MIDILKLIKYLIFGSLLLYLGYRVCYPFYLEGIIDLINAQQILYQSSNML